MRAELRCRRRRFTTRLVKYRSVFHCPSSVPPQTTAWIAIHSVDLSNPLPDGFTPDSTPHGFGFTSVDGATIGTISGTVDSTTATVLVSINTDNYADKTVRLRYRIYGSGSEWTTTQGEDRDEVEFTLENLTDGSYYEIEASMGSDFMSCTVIKAIGTIGSPTGETPPAITTPTEPSIIATHLPLPLRLRPRRQQPPPRPLQLTTTAAVEASALAADNPRIRHRSSGTAPVNHAWSLKIAYREKW